MVRLGCILDLGSHWMHALTLECLLQRLRTRQRPSSRQTSAWLPAPMCRRRPLRAMHMLQRAARATPPIESLMEKPR